MIRGAIAFALVLKITFDDGNGEPCENCYSRENYELVVTTTLSLVMLTTLIFGTFMDPVQKILVPSKKGEEEAEALSHDGGNGKATDHYEEIVHPNEEKESETNMALSRRPSYIGGK